MISLSLNIMQAGNGPLEVQISILEGLLVILGIRLSDLAEGKAIKKFRALKPQLHFPQSLWDSFFFGRINGLESYTILKK